jgi:hypothetical protein
MTAVPRKTPAIRKVASELPTAAKASAPDNQYAIPLGRMTHPAESPTRLSGACDAVIAAIVITPGG